jgi:hypothetical protein
MTVGSGMGRGMNDKIISRIERLAGVPGLTDLLAEQLTPTDLQSLLLEVHRRRAAKRTPADLLHDYESNRFVSPATTDPRDMTRFDALVWKHLPPSYDALELSPVAPLGSSSAVAPVNQNLSITTIRNTEVISDATNVLALECAVRRRNLLKGPPRNAGQVNLAAIHRVVRGQLFDSPEAYSHFRLLGLCAAGRDEGSFEFEIRNLIDQIGFYLALIAEFSTIKAARVAITDLEEGRRKAHLEREVLARFRSTTPVVTTEFDDDRVGGRGYYSAVCFKIYVTRASGREMEIIDGGFTNWTQLLLSNAKERLLISGLGIERLLSS